MSRFARWGLGATALVLSAGLAVAWSGAASAQDTKPTITVTGPTESVKKGAEGIAFVVGVADVEDASSFQFVLQFDPDILEFQEAQKGDFLASTGREMICNEPVIDAAAVRYNCTTLRAEGEGADGAGTLATMLFRAKGSGTTTVDLDRVKMNQLVPGNPDVAPEITEFNLQNTSIKVQGSGGMNWLIWGTVIGVIALVVIAAAVLAATRMRGGSGKPATAV